MTQSFHDAFLERIHGSTPSTRNWSTFEPAATQICGGALLHSLLPRAFERAFYRELAEDLHMVDEDGDEEIPWSVFNCIGIQKAGAYLFNQNNIKHLLLSLITTEPLDALNQRIQHLDAVGGCIREMTNEIDGPLAQTQMKFADILLDRAVDVPLECVYFHFDSTEERYRKIEPYPHTTPLSK